MSEETSKSTPAWTWLVIGGLVASLVFLIVQRDGEPPATTADNTELTSHLKQVTKRLKTLEAESQRLRAEQKRTALSQMPVIATNNPKNGSSTSEGRPQAAKGAVPVQNSRRMNPKNDNSATAWNPPAFDDGHVFEDGVTVNMNPDVPAAKDPIPASAQVSQDNGAAMKAAFPQGCPTCE